MKDLDVAESPSRIAFHHPWPPIDGHLISGWLKTMLLFFDGVAVLVAPAEHHLLLKGQEETIYPLHDAGLLHILDPHEMVDESAALALVDFVLELATQEERDAIEHGPNLEVRGLLRGPWTGTRRLDESERAASRMVWTELQRRGLASGFSPDDDIYVRSDKWQQILAFLAQAIRPAGLRVGLDLQPATDDPRMIDNFPVIRSRRNARQGDIVTFDLEQVAIDMSNVPLDDLLGFREQRGSDYRSYARNVQRFALELTELQAENVAGAFLQRRNQLADEADCLRDAARTWWRRPAASVGLGLIGAGISAAENQWASALVSILTGIVGAPPKSRPRGAFTYLFKTEERFPDLDGWRTY